MYRFKKKNVEHSKEERRISPTGPDINRSSFHFLIIIFLKCQQEKRISPLFLYQHGEIQLEHKYSVQQLVQVSLL